MKEEKAVQQIEVSQSRIKTFLACNRLEYYRYRAGEGVGVESTRPETFFVEGEFGHYALMHFYRTGMMLRQNMLKRMKKIIDSLQGLDPEEFEEYSVKVSAMMGAALGYKARYKNDLSQFNILGVEQTFEVEVFGVKVVGKIDLAVEDKTTKKCGFIEHKFVTIMPNADRMSSLPLDVQGLIYTLGFKKLFGKSPDWYRFNYVRKSALRRKGPTKDKPGYNEPLEQFEARVGEQYLNEPDKMFWRTPEMPVEENMAKRVGDQLGRIVTGIVENVDDKQDQPDMNFESCDGKYGRPCSFVPACTAYLAGKKQGWNAPECMGLYRSKAALNPELIEEKEEEVKK